MKIKKLYDQYNIGLLLSAILMPQVMYILLDWITPYEEGIYSKLPEWICLFAMTLSFFSLARCSVVFNQPLREKYLAKDDPSFCSNCSFLFHQKPFWIKVALFGLLYLLLPLEWTYKALAAAFQIGESFSGKLMALAILYPVLMLAAILAHLSAYQFWINQTPDTDYSKKAYNIEIAVIFGIYLIGALALTMWLPLIVSILRLLGTFAVIKFLLIVLSLFFTFSLLRVIRAVRIRRNCLKRLHELCAEKRYSISEIQKPYRSIFKLFPGESFHVRVGEKRYSCKLIGGRKKYVPLIIDRNGYLTFIHTVRFLKFELFQFRSTYDYGYESDVSQILIVNPTPKFVYMHQNPIPVKIDNGQKIGNYKFFTATAFLRALELDVLDK